MAIDFTKILHSGDKYLVKENDIELIREIEAILERVVHKFSNSWEKIYKSKNKKIIGTIIHFSTMAKSEDRNLLVRATQWGINPRLEMKASDERLLEQLAMK